MRSETILCPQKNAGEAYRHTHETWEFILSYEGDGFISVDHVRYPFTSGTVVCVPPGALHYNWSDKRYSQIAVRFTGFENPTQHPVLVFQDDRDKTFESLARIMLRLFNDNGNCNSEILDSLCTVLCTLIVSAVSAAKIHPQIEAFKHAVMFRFMDPEFTVSDAYGELNYSEGHFRKLFRQQMGITPIQYLTDCRLEYGRKLLQSAGVQKGSSVASIALRSGFYDQKYFTRLFRKKFGVTPQKCRRLNAAGQIPDDFAGNDQSGHGGNKGNTAG